jgi:predicted RND superfamily exporter protein
MYVYHETARMYGSPYSYDHMQVLLPAKCTYIMKLSICTVAPAVMITCKYFFSAISTIIPPFLGHDNRIFILIFFIPHNGSAIRIYIPSQFIIR